MAQEYSKADYVAAQEAFNLAKKQTALRTQEHFAVEQIAKTFKKNRDNSLNSVKSNATKEANKKITEFRKEVLALVEDKDLKAEIKKIKI